MEARTLFSLPTVAVDDINEPAMITTQVVLSASHTSDLYLERKRPGGRFAPVGLIPTGTTTLLDEGLDNGTTYLYRVTDGTEVSNAVTQRTWRVGDADGDGAFTNDDYGLLDATFNNMGDPGIFGDLNSDGIVSPDDYGFLDAVFGSDATSATASITGASGATVGAPYTLTLAYTDTGYDAVDYWEIDWGDGSAVQTVAGNITSVVHHFERVTGSVTVEALAYDWDGDWDDDKALGTLSGVGGFALSQTPTSPTELTATWDAVSGADNYKLEFSNDGSTYFDEEELGDVTTIDFAFLEPGEFDYLRVKSYAGSTLLATSNLDFATTELPTPAMVDTLLIYDAGSGDYQLEWFHGNFEANGYVLERSADSSFADPEAITTFFFTPDSDEFTDTSVPSSTTAYYRMRAVGEAGYGENSNVVGTDALTGIPEELTSAPLEDTILVAWHGVHDPSNGNRSFGDVRLANMTEFIDDTLNPGGGSPLKLIEGPYNHDDGDRALRDLLAAIDGRNDPLNIKDKKITADEVAGLTINFLAYSWGTIDAVKASRHLRGPSVTPFRNSLLGYKIQTEVRIDKMVMLDPIISGLPGVAKRLTGAVEDNVDELKSYYQRRGARGNMVIRSIDTTDWDDYLGFSNPVSSSSPFVYGTSVLEPLKGRPIPSVGSASVTNINVNVTYANRLVTRPHGNRNPNVSGAESIFSPQVRSVTGQLLGSNVNHSTLPYYIFRDVIQEFLGYLPTSQTETV